MRNGLDLEGDKDLGLNCSFLALEMKAPEHSNFQVLEKGNSVPPLREKGRNFAKKGREKSSSRWVIIGVDFSIFFYLYMPRNNIIYADKILSKFLTDERLTVLENLLHSLPSTL